METGLSRDLSSSAGWAAESREQNFGCPNIDRRRLNFYEPSLVLQEDDVEQSTIWRAWLLRLNHHLFRCELSSLSLLFAQLAKSVKGLLRLRQSTRFLTGLPEKIIRLEHGWIQADCRL